MSCLCKPKCTTTSTACTCSGCSGSDCSESFKKLFKGIDCNALVVSSCPSKEQVETNFKILAAIKTALCKAAEYDIHKETTHSDYLVPKVATNTPYGAPSDPCIGDLHSVTYLEVPETETTDAEFSFGLYKWNGTKWIDILGDQVCLSETTMLALKPDRFFIDNVIGLDRIDTGFSFIGVDYKDMQVIWNDGHEIYHRDEQVYTGTVVYDFNTVDGNIFFLHGPKGDGAYLTPVFLGTADDPAYFKVIVNKYGSSSSVLSC
jgi:hypothetical protein